MLRYIAELDLNVLEVLCHLSQRHHKVEPFVMLVNSVRIKFWVHKTAQLELINQILALLDVLTVPQDKCALQQQ